MRLEKSARIAAASYMGLFILWGGLEICIVPFLARWFDDTTIVFIKEVVLKIVVWFVPAVLLCRHYHGHLGIQMKLFLGKIPWSKLLPVLLLFTTFHLVSAYVEDGAVFISSSFRAADILIAVSVGIGEEMVFRGWLLNVSLRDKTWRAVLVNAVLFLLIHFPVWIQQGLLFTYATSGAFLQIMALSVIFSWSFLKSRNMLAPVILHAYWDFLCFLF